MPKKCWKIGGLEIAKPRQQDRFSWIGMLATVVLVLAAAGAVWALYEAYGKVGQTVGTVGYFIFGYGFIVVSDDLWSYRRGAQSDPRPEHNTFFVVLGFLVLVSIMAILWPLFAGEDVERVLRARRK